MDLRNLSLLGRGAMGRVYRGFDEELRREVAVKELRSDDPAAVELFQREARAQARVDHPNVAKVFEVGMRDGRPCISMQLVDGVPLDEALRGRPLEEKARVLRTVARAVHAAHEVGLIHRDLKPSNILVEDRSGELVPFVLDFGLARTLEGTRHTTAGELVGTAGYLSPEQARGDVDSVDRRSDVFSLGIVLYEVLAGENPFAGRSEIETLVRVVEGDAPPLQRRAPGLPRDLRAIVERCLERRPADRYASARALADDLDRWLRGETVQARPLSRAGRVWRQARRRPVGAAVVAGALLVVVAVAAWAVATEARAAKRAELSRELGQTIERLESSLRLTYLAPAHDVRSAEARIEAEIAEIGRRAEALPQALRAPALYARARGLMALDHWSEALPLLEQAAASLGDDPAVRLALGRVLCERYREEIEAAQRIESPRLRRAAVEEARHLYADRAGELLASSAEAGLRPHEAVFLEGLLALLEDDLEAAAAAGASASRGAPWFYEGHLLRAEALLRRAVAAMARGASDEAETAIAGAREAAERAEAVGRSDPAAATMVCRVHGRELALRSLQTGGAEAAYRRAVAACDRALALDPEHWPALSQLADVGWRMAGRHAEQGRDPQAELEAAAAAARRGLELEESPRLMVHLGNIHWVWGNWLRDQGLDAEPRYEGALELMQRAVELRSGDPYLWWSLGNAWTQRGFAGSLAGEDPHAAFRAAEDAFVRGLDAPGAYEARLANARCGLHSHWGYHLHQRGGDPREHYETAVASCRRTLEIDPDDLGARGNLALALWSVALWEAEQGEDADPRFREAEEAFEDQLRRDPERVTPRLNLTSLHLDWARSRLDREADAAEPLAGVPPHLDVVDEAYPEEAPALRARLVLLRARQAERAGNAEAGALYARAVEDARQAYSDAFPVFTGRILAEALRHRARHQAVHGDTAAAMVTAREGLELTRSLLERAPKVSDLRRARDELEALVEENGE